MFSKTDVSRLKWDGRSFDFRPCEEDARFGVRLYESGRKIWCLRYRLLGNRAKVHTLKLESVGLRTPKEVWLDARRLLIALDSGQNPKALRETQKRYTLQELSDSYLKRLDRKASAKTISEARRRLDKRIIPALNGDTFLEHIERADIQKMHEEISEDGAVEANRCVQLVRAMFSHAEKGEHLPDHYPNPAVGVDLNTERSKDRYLDTEELGRLFEALQKEDINTKAKVLLTLGLALRKSELLSLRWENVQLEWFGDEAPHIKIPKTKNGLSHRLPLMEEQVAILKQLEQMQLGVVSRKADRYKDLRITRSPWVFPSYTDWSKHTQDFKSTWRRLRKNAGLIYGKNSTKETPTWHDLRRTCASIMAQKNVPIEVAMQILNHSDKQITRIYYQLSNQQTTQALEVVQEAISEGFGTARDLRLA